MKNKKLQKLALGAEIVSAVAVVITIGFLTYQMMDNTNALQAQTFQNLMRDINSWRLSIRELEAGPTLSKLRNDGIESLTRGEQGRTRLAYVQLWGIYEAAFFANERGVLGPDEWTRFEFSICDSRYGIVSNFWDYNYEDLPAFSEILTPKFAEFVETNCVRPVGE
jgi:hypothetical protein